MDFAVLQWKQSTTYFNYGPYDADEAESLELFEWHREMYHYVMRIYEECGGCAALDFQGRFVTVHYLECGDKVFLPGENTKFEQLEPIPVEQLTSALDSEAVYELRGITKERFKRIISIPEPLPKPILNNEYDFRKIIGTGI